MGNSEHMQDWLQAVPWSRTVEFTDCIMSCRHTDAYVVLCLHVVQASNQADTIQLYACGSTGL